MGDHLGVEFLKEVDPSGGAGGEHGEGAFAFEAAEEFAGFFDDGEVGSQVGVEYGVETETAKCGDHFLGCGGAGREAESFADGGADGGGCLDDDMDVGVAEGVPDGAHVGFFEECGCGADVDALSALDAHGVVHLGHVGGADDGVKAAGVLAEVHGRLVFRRRRGRIGHRGCIFPSRGLRICLMFRLGIACVRLQKSVRGPLGNRARFWSSQLPSRSQSGSPWGWLSRRSSTMSRRARRISGELVWTSIPSHTLTLHEAM